MEGEGAWGNVSWCEDGQSIRGSGGMPLGHPTVSEVLENPFVATHHLAIQCVE